MFLSRWRVWPDFVLLFFIEWTLTVTWHALSFLSPRQLEIFPQKKGYRLKNAHKTKLAMDPLRLISPSVWPVAVAVTRRWGTQRKVSFRYLAYNYGIEVDGNAVIEGSDHTAPDWDQPGNAPPLAILGSLATRLYRPQIRGLGAHFKEFLSVRFEGAAVDDKPTTRCANCKERKISECSVADAGRSHSKLMLFHPQYWKYYWHSTPHHSSCFEPKRTQIGSN